MNQSAVKVKLRFVFVSHFKLLYMTLTENVKMRPAYVGICGSGR